MTTTTDVRDFYNQFADSVLINDFFYLNPRHEAIRRLCDRFIPNGGSVLEIGCGAGIITSYLANRSSRVLALDISDRNIEIASTYVNNARCEFKVLDIVEQGSELAGYGPFDAVLLADVIEHIPKERYPSLFEAMEQVLSPTGVVVITHPSPEVQEYLTEHDPGTMQVIDERIELGDILGASSLKPIHFSYESVSAINEYIHLVLTADRSYVHRPPKQSLLDLIRHRARKYRWRSRNRAFLRKIKSQQE